MIKLHNKLNESKQRCLRWLTMPQRCSRCHLNWESKFETLDRCVEQGARMPDWNWKSSRRLKCKTKFSRFQISTMHRALESVTQWIPLSKARRRSIPSVYFEAEFWKPILKLNSEALFRDSILKANSKAQLWSSIFDLELFENSPPSLFD